MFKFCLFFFNHSIFSKEKQNPENIANTPKTLYDSAHKPGGTLQKGNFMHLVLSPRQISIFI